MSQLTPVQAQIAKAASNKAEAEQALNDLLAKLINTPADSTLHEQIKQLQDEVATYDRRIASFGLALAEEKRRASKAGRNTQYRAAAEAAERIKGAHHRAKESLQAILKGLDELHIHFETWQAACNDVNADASILSRAAASEKTRSDVVSMRTHATLAAAGPYIAEALFASGITRSGYRMDYYISLNPVTPGVDFKKFLASETVRTVRVVDEALANAAEALGQTKAVA